MIRTGRTRGSFAAQPCACPRCPPAYQGPGSLWACPLFSPDRSRAIVESAEDEEGANRAVHVRGTPPFHTQNQRKISGRKSLAKECTRLARIGFAVQVDGGRFGWLRFAGFEGSTVFMFDADFYLDTLAPEDASIDTSTTTMHLRLLAARTKRLDSTEQRQQTHSWSSVQFFATIILRSAHNP